MVDDQEDHCKSDLILAKQVDTEGDDKDIVAESDKGEVEEGREDGDNERNGFPRPGVGDPHAL